MGAKFITEQHVTPYGIAETRKPFTPLEQKPMTDAEQKAAEKAEADKQFAAAKITLANRSEEEKANDAAHINSKATTDAHIGHHPNDEVKPRAMEAVKTDLKETLGDPHVERVPQKTDGETTDMITKNPEEAQPQSHPLNESQKAQEAIKESGGKKKRKGRK